MAPPFSKVALSGPGGGDFVSVLPIHNCKQIKGLPVFRDEGGVHPKRVREYQIKDAPFFGTLTLLIPLDGPLREFQEFDPLVDVAGMGQAMPIDLGAQVGELGLPLLGLRGEELSGDHLIELIQVQGFQAAF